MIEQERVRQKIQYNDVDMEEVYSVVQNHLGDLRTFIAIIIKKYFDLTG